MCQEENIFGALQFDIHIPYNSDSDSDSSSDSSDPDGRDFQGHIDKLSEPPTDKKLWNELKRNLMVVENYMFWCRRKSGGNYCGCKTRVGIYK